MATAKMIITDIDLDTGEVRMDFEVEGSTTDDGKMTAAEVMLRILHNEVTLPDFKNKVWAALHQIANERGGITITNDNMDPTKEEAQA